MSTRVAIQRWLDATQRRFTSRTHSQYNGVIWRFADYMPEYIKNLTVEHIERYLASLKNHSNRTINGHLVTIKSFCRWVSEAYGLPNTAAKVKKLPEIPPRQRVINDEEYQKILSVCVGDQADLIRFLANTGLRSSELCSLKPENISQDRQTLWVLSKGGKKTRVIPLNRTSQQILAREPNPFHFLKSLHHRNTLYKLCKKLSRKAGIPIAGPHSYRHFFATKLMQKGVPIAKISKILGHASITTTEKVYLHWTVADVKGVTDVLD